MIGTVRQFRSFGRPARVLFATEFGMAVAFLMLAPYLADHLVHRIGLALWLAGLILGSRHFGEGVFLFGGTLADPGGFHPLFWASKLHFFITDLPFYNFPYVFGFLFATRFAGAHAGAGSADAEDPSARLPWGRRLIRMGAVVLLAGLLAAPQILPTLELIPLSERRAMPTEMGPETALKTSSSRS